MLLHKAIQDHYNFGLPDFDQGGWVARGRTGDLEGLSLRCHGNQREEGELDWCVHVCAYISGREVIY